MDFTVAEPNGTVVVRAATDGSGEAEVALTPGRYELSQDVLDRSADVTTGDGRGLAMGAGSLGAVTLEAEADEPPKKGRCRGPGGCCPDVQPSASVEVGGQATTITVGYRDPPSSSEAEDAPR